jgi:hypothetical protein
VAWGSEVINKCHLLLRDGRRENVFRLYISGNLENTEEFKEENYF